MKLKCWAVLAAVALLVALVPAAPSGAQESKCYTYYDTGLAYYQTYGWTCGGRSTNSCTECHKWTSASSVESCVTVGTGDCFKPAVKQV